jgi:hypothetical protein
VRSLLRQRSTPSRMMISFADLNCVQLICTLQCARFPNDPVRRPRSRLLSTVRREPCHGHGRDLASWRCVVAILRSLRLHLDDSEACPARQLRQASAPLLASP